MLVGPGLVVFVLRVVASEIYDEYAYSDGYHDNSYGDYAEGSPDYVPGADSGRVRRFGEVTASTRNYEDINEALQKIMIGRPHLLKGFSESRNVWIESSTDPSLSDHDLSEDNDDDPSEQFQPSFKARQSLVGTPNQYAALEEVTWSTILPTFFSFNDTETYSTFYGLTTEILTPWYKFAQSTIPPTRSKLSKAEVEGQSVSTLKTVGLTPYEAVKFYTGKVTRSTGRFVSRLPRVNVYTIQSQADSMMMTKNTYDVNYDTSDLEYKENFDSNEKKNIFRVNSHNLNTSLFAITNTPITNVIDPTTTFVFNYYDSSSTNAIFPASFIKNKKTILTTSQSKNNIATLKEKVLRNDATTKKSTPAPPANTSTTLAKTGTTSANNGTTTAINGTTSAINGTTSAINGTTSANNGTTSAMNGTTSAINGTTTAKTNTTTSKSTKLTTTTNQTTTSKSPYLVFDIESFLSILANLTYDYYTNLTEVMNATLRNNTPTCAPTDEKFFEYLKKLSSSSTTTTTTTPAYEPPKALNNTVIAKCFVCGLHAPAIPFDSDCADAFAGDFLPLTPVNPIAKSHVSKFRKYCRYGEIYNFHENATRPRSIYGRWTGGCSVRWTDLTGLYTQRACRNRKRAITGQHYASKRMAKLEMALQHTDTGCIISPVATLLPLSRAVSLFARFHACVCVGSWCNGADGVVPSATAVLAVVVWAYR